MAKDIQKVLSHAIKNNMNVLLKGRHGVGKTAMIQQAFDEAGLKWKYYSASTMDPWVDFIGVPKEKSDENGNTYLDLVRPRDIACDEIEAIFFDELNRAHKKIRNAVMELIQFKSINGKKFNNLKIVWAAVNPDDEEGTYDVERLDPAQIDRFQIHIDVPNNPDMKFFKIKYPQHGERAVKWWNGLDKSTQTFVSPRRLDYALEVMTNGGDPRYVLDYRCNVNSFISTMSKGDPAEICEELFTKIGEEIRKYLADNNNYKHIADVMLSQEKYIRSLAPHLPQEVLLKELTPRTNSSRNSQLISFVAHNARAFDYLTDSILSAANASVYSDLLTRAFESHRQTKIEAEKAAINTSKAVMDKLMNSKLYDQVPPSGSVNTSMNLDQNTTNRYAGHTVTLNGTSVKIDEMTPVKYLAMTGKRFRVTQEQAEQIDKGYITRDNALRDFLMQIRDIN